MEKPEIIFAGDRKIAVNVLRYLLDSDVRVSGLCLPNIGSASHDEQLIKLCNHLDDDRIFRGTEFKSESNKKRLERIIPDYMISVHFQHFIPKEILEIPIHGVVNLHPAYLPYNRGWHTPSWAILDQTPYGATLHFMEEEIDAGDIIARKRIEIKPEDTANTLYQKALTAEFELFKQSWPDLAEFNYTTSPQSETEATTHTRDELKKIQKLNLEQSVKTEELIKKIRALTTNKIEEAAYYEKENKKYYIQVDIVPELELDSS
ncbi:Methionyl-tRNA formyltransferase [Halorubrum aquaticum]|uniref:Methionyl-tRNA formyltransferase n=1 Tax=Halorubrum aquaticum TaxID=387340 RepID=A0A1I3A5U1_9EURY|nr:formyltransferase family protein [Halorubrum aquaticum]SFH45236.1 Methionyl-tRNA formyltransferase [Halorubrum aquaticum]